MRLAAFLGSALLITSARAESEAPTSQRNEWDRHVTPKVHFGTSHAAYGGLAGSIEYAPIRYFAIDVGAGYGRKGFTSAALLRGRIGDDTLQIGLGSGISTGPGRDDRNDCDDWNGAYPPMLPCAASREFGSRSIDRAWFAVTELTFEMRSSAGLHGGMAFGWSQVLNRASDWRCLDDCSSAAPPPRGRPYFDLVFGWSFG